MRTFLLAVALVTAACRSTKMIAVPDPVLAGTVFHVTAPDNLPMSGVGVCHQDTCATTNLRGDAGLDLPLGVEVFIIFRPPDHAPFGEIYTPAGVPIHVVLHL